MSRLYYANEVKRLVDTATAQLVRDVVLEELGDEEKADCALRNKLSGIFAMGDRIKAMADEEE